MKKTSDNTNVDLMLKKGLGEYIDNLPETDTEQEWLKFSHRYEKSNNKKYRAMAASLAIIVIVSTVLIPSVSQAFREFIERNVIKNISETVDIHQYGNTEEYEYKLITTEDSFYSSYQELKDAELEQIFIPSEDISQHFISATIVGDPNFIRAFTINFAFDEDAVQLIQRPKRGQSSSAIAIDNEDYIVEQITISDLPINVFKHKSGVVIFEWEHSGILYQLEAEVNTQQLLEIANRLELF